MHRYGYKDRRTSSYSSDDSDSDCEAQPDHKISRFVGDVAEKTVQPFEIATKMVLNPVFGLLSSSPKPKGKKSRQGRHEDAYYSGHGKQHHSGQKMQYHGEHGMTMYQDRTMAPQVPPSYDNRNPSYGSGRALVTKSSEYSRVSSISCGNHKGGQRIQGF